MRIGINALYLLPGKVGGSEVYVRNLVKWLDRVRGKEEFFIFINRESAGVFEVLAPGFKIIQCALNAENRPLRILWEQFVLPLQLRRYRIDVLLSAGMTAPFFCPVPSFVTVHDLQHINQPENFKPSYLLFLRAIIYLSAASSSGIFTLSEKSKSDIARFYKISPENITVTPLASDESVFFRRPGEDVDSVRKKYGLPGRFILYTASSLLHKNYERLLKAFKAVHGAVPGIKLVLIGARDYGQDAIKDRIKELDLEDSTVFLGWLPFEDIPAIYCASEAFVFPSLHEGFGIPVLEAFSCGVPVVCSRIEPVSEVAKDAALFVDPMKEDDIARGILEVLRDRALRDTLIERGINRARDFSWENTARKTLSTISSYMARK